MSQLPAFKNIQVRINQKHSFMLAWLALQEDPGTPMGLAVTKKYLTNPTESSRDLIEWLNKLFN